MNDAGARSSPLNRRVRVEAICLGVSSCLFVWTGCSVEKNYELLSVFFDGVPNPNAMPVLASAGDPTSMRMSPTYSAHTPFLNAGCAECHGQGFTMNSVGPDVCLSCHEGATDEFRYMHGPVAFGACLVCHVPHESAYRALLKTDTNEVCTQCHAPSMLSVDAVPEHRDERVSCVRCHTGHGDDQRYMLRDEPLIVPSAAQAEAPVEDRPSGGDAEPDEPVGTAEPDTPEPEPVTDADAEG